MNRPKSASDAQTLAKQDAQAVVEPLSSPTKGILMTPGTAAAKKKNVTFGDHVVDNEEKRPMKSGLPDDCPGKFPSQLADDLDKGDEPVEKGRGRSKLTEAFEQARDESRKRKSKTAKRGKKDYEEEDDLAPEIAEPRSESGKYWKHEYDIYRNNTQREVKKLITKQKAAKSYALTKDLQCTELADQLKQEHKRVEGLEAKTEELSTQMKELYEKMQASQEAERKYRDEVAMLKRQLGRKDSARPTSSNGVATAPAERPKPEQRMSKELVKAEVDPVQKPPERPKPEHRVSKDLVNPENDPVQKPSEPYKPSAEAEKPKVERPTLRARTKSKPDDVQLQPSDDIWAQLDTFGASSPTALRSKDRQLVSPKAGRAVTSGTGATPLTLLDVNMLSNSRDAKRNSSLTSMEVECKSNPDLERLDSKDSPKNEEQQKQDSPMRSPGLPLPSPEPVPVTKPVFKQEPPQRKPVGEEPAPSDLSIPVPNSSPFQPHAKTLPTRSSVSLAGPRELLNTKPMPPNNTKENVSPTSSKPHTPQNELHVKPSVIWSSINAPHGSKRNASVTGKDGKEVTVDRLEAARARVNARGRVTT